MESLTRDLNASSTRSLRRSFSSGIVGSRAVLGLRHHYIDQVRRAHSECGFDSITVPGLFLDEMGFTPRSLKKKQTFVYTHLLFDTLLDTGITPVIHIDSVPSTIAAEGTKDRYWWKQPVSIPRSYPRWLNLVEHFLEEMVHRYGISRVSSWKILLGSDSDYYAAFNYSENDFFRFYEKTARIIKKVVPNLQVGGPSSSAQDTRFLERFFSRVKDFEVPLDFIALQAYRYDTGVDGSSGSKIILPAKTRSIIQQAVGTLALIEKSFDIPPPLYFTSFGITRSEPAALHDSYLGAVMLLHELQQTRHNVAGTWIRRVSDIEESSGPPPELFHGASGLYTANGLEKPVCQIFKFLEKLGDQELIHEYEDCIATTDKDGGIQVLLWHPFIFSRDVVSNVLFNSSHPPDEEGKYTLRLKGLAPAHYHLKESRIGFKLGDPYSLYLEQNRPGSFSMEDLALYRDISVPVTTSSRVTVRSDRLLHLQLPLRSGDVVFLEAKPASL